MLKHDATSETEANKAVVRRYIEEVNNGCDLALADELIAPDYIWHHGPSSRDDLKRFIAWQRATAPTWRITIQDMVAEGDRVAVRATARGICSEERPGVPYLRPRYRESTWIAIYRVEGGRIAELWVTSRAETSRDEL